MLDGMGLLLLNFVMLNSGVFMKVLELILIEERLYGI
jgi:hypothetical protein